MSPSYHNQLFTFFANSLYKRNNIFASFGIFRLAKWFFSKVYLLLLFNGFPLTRKVILFFSSPSLIPHTNSESNVSYNFWKCSYFWVTTAISSVIFPFTIEQFSFYQSFFLFFKLFLRPKYRMHELSKALIYLKLDDHLQFFCILGIVQICWTWRAHC